jgi:hypothetical protein
VLVAVFTQMAAAAQHDDARGGRWPIPVNVVYDELYVGRLALALFAAVASACKCLAADALPGAAGVSEA